MNLTEFRRERIAEKFSELVNTYNFETVAPDQDYLNFLSGGCSKAPIDLLKDAGVDMTGPEAVNQALALFDTLLDELETLMEV